jgi:DNA-binding GntR family transcriptional regulator
MTLAVRESDDIYRVLRQSILSGNTGVANRLVEDELAAQFGVSRTPVREALRRLEHDGLAERLRRGMLVAVPITEQERADIHLMRLEMDRLAARLACARAQPADWASARDRVHQMADVVQSESQTSMAFELAHLEVHAAINRIAFHGRVGGMLSRQLTAYSSIADTDYVQQPGFDPVSQHLALIDELATGDESRAVTAVELHARRGPAGEDQNA